MASDDVLVVGRFPRLRSLDTEHFVIATSRGAATVEVWSDGLVAIGDGDTVVAGADDLVPLLIGLGLLEFEARRLADEFRRESLSPLWERWGLTTGN